MRTVPLSNWSAQFKITQPGLYSCALTADLIPFAQIRALTRSCDGLGFHGRSRQANNRTKISLFATKASKAAAGRSNMWIFWGRAWGNLRFYRDHIVTKTRRRLGSVASPAGFEPLSPP